MDAEYRRTLAQALPAQGNGSGERFGGSGVEDLIDHRLARKPRQHRVTQRAEAVQTREQFVVLLRGLGEAEAGVEDDVFTPDARGEPYLDIV